jgi:hypothetical protein
MNRREAFGVIGLGATGLVVGPSALASENGKDAAPPAGPPRLTAEELARRVGEKGFQPESLYAHEFEFRGVVLIKRAVPLLQIKDMEGSYSKVHLHGSGGNFDVGKELMVTGLIVDNGFGALMVWKRECQYAEG